jgi:hypothetical protein
MLERLKLLRKRLMTKITVGDIPHVAFGGYIACSDLFEREVIPEFYTRDANGIPNAWVARIRESMARLTPRFSTNRTVHEYTEQHYLPAAAAYRGRAADKGAVGREIVDWRHALEQKWALLHFGEVKVQTNTLDLNVLDWLSAAAPCERLPTSGSSNFYPKPASPSVPIMMRHLPRP